MDLRRRFEAPIEKNRWDFPLFRVWVTPTEAIPVMVGVPAGEGSNGCNSSTCNTPNSLIGDIASEMSEMIFKESEISGGQRKEAVKNETVNKESIKDGNVKIVPLTSTKGQIDINCLAADKIPTVGFRAETVFDKITVPVTLKSGSSWRPKIRSDGSVNSSARAFTSLAGDTTVKTAYVSSSSSSGCGGGSGPTALSISGSIPVIAPDDQSQSQESIMNQIFLHLTNTGRVAAPNSSTISVPRVNADLLHELDRTSQNITQRITAHQTENAEGEKTRARLIVGLALNAAVNAVIDTTRDNNIISRFHYPTVSSSLLRDYSETPLMFLDPSPFPPSPNFAGTPLIFQDFNRTLALHRHVGLAELQRHRRQFVKTNSNMSHSSTSVLGSLFIDSLALNL